MSSDQRMTLMATMAIMAAASGRGVALPQRPGFRYKIDKQPIDGKDPTIRKEKSDSLKRILAGKNKLR